MSLTSSTPNGAVLLVRVTPRAGRTGLTGVANDQLLVRIAAAPVDDAANEALIELLARVLGVAKQSIDIVGGHRGRTKRVAIAGLSAAEVERRVARLLK